MGFVEDESESGQISMGLFVSFVIFPMFVLSPEPVPLNNSRINNVIVITILYGCERLVFHSAGRTEVRGVRE
jgi:hypothetical protein